MLWEINARVKLNCFYLHRYDLLCLEGLAQALRVFGGVQEIPTYTLADIRKDAMLKMHVKPEVVILYEKHLF